MTKKQIIITAGILIIVTTTFYSIIRNVLPKISPAEQVQSNEEQGISQQTKPALLTTDLYPLPAQISWNTPREKTYDEYYDHENLDGKGFPKQVLLVGYEVTSRDSTEGYDLFNYYENILPELGWESTLSLDADGPMGSRWGYKRGNEYIIFESDTVFLEPQPDDRPAECPCEYRYVIFSGTEVASAAPAFTR